MPKLIFMLTFSVMPYGIKWFYYGGFITFNFLLCICIVTGRAFDHVLEKVFFTFVHILSLELGVYSVRRCVLVEIFTMCEL